MIASAPGAGGEPIAGALPDETREPVAKEPLDAVDVPLPSFLPPPPSPSPQGLADPVRKASPYGSEAPPASFGSELTAVRPVAAGVPGEGRLGAEVPNAGRGPAEVPRTAGPDRQVRGAQPGARQAWEALRTRRAPIGAGGLPGSDGASEPAARRREQERVGLGGGEQPSAPIRVSATGPGLVTRAGVRRTPERVVARLDLRSVALVSALGYLAALAVFLVAGVLLWQVALVAGEIHRLERLLDSLGFTSAHIDGWALLLGALLVGLVLVGLGTVVNLVAAAVYNLVAELVGGIRVTVGGADEGRPLV